MISLAEEYNDDDIAIISVGGRFPGAKTIGELWNIINEGKEKIQSFSDEELKKSKIPEYLLKDCNYVKASAVIEDIDMFDANFFKFNAREAEVLNPQHRVFLECCWELLESAGYNIDKYKGRIGVYAGEGFNSYFMDIASNIEFLQKINEIQALIGNDKDFLSTQVSYKLNLTGPSMTVQAGCSSSLLATSIACQGLRDYQCDMAIAGGIRLGTPQKVGYLYKEGSILSKDGHCRPFDNDANGTVGGNGAALVLLKRLQDALDDGDYIYAVIKGTAVNNDGSLKIGYTAPSVDGQAESIYEALEVGGISAESIGYIETHGTGTVLGDPIEFEALNKVFSSKTMKKNFCALGAVKANIGHLDAAAGVTGLIKAALAINKKVIPPLANFKTINPKIKIQDSPFYIPTKPIEWNMEGGRRRAGVSSFGIGGTNVHVVLEEAPQIKGSDVKSKVHILPISAGSEKAIKDMRENLINHLRENVNGDIADIAYTLQQGRKNFNHREVIICKSISNGIEVMESLNNDFFARDKVDECRDNIVFMFPGQGSQYISMGRQLYEEEETFKDNFDLCCKLFKRSLGIELREIIYPNGDNQNNYDINETYIAQAVLFAIEYSLAKTLIAFGIIPNAMIGHSLGEYVAACLAGIFSVEDAIELISVRGRMMQSQERGLMISVLMDIKSVNSFINDEISIAAINSPLSCVLSGSEKTINELEQRLKENNISFVRLNTSHAFHSKMMEPMIDSYRERLKKIDIKVNKIPILSNVTGTWFKENEIKDVETWCKHIVNTVRFSDEIQTLLNYKPTLFIEVGPGNNLASFVRKHLNGNNKHHIITSMRSIRQEKYDYDVLLNCIGKAWTKGVNINWSKMYKGERRIRVPLPTYPFERNRYWIEKGYNSEFNPFKSTSLEKESDISKWMYAKYWKPKSLSTNKSDENTNFMIFCDAYGLGEIIGKKLKLLGHNVTSIYSANKYCHISDDIITINSCNIKDYEMLFREVHSNNKVPHNILHLWSVDNVVDTLDFNKVQQMSFYSLINVIQALSRVNISDNMKITVVSSDIQAVFSADNIYPEKSTLLSLILTIPQEYPNLAVTHIDLSSKEFNKLGYMQYTSESIINEVFSMENQNMVAYRNNLRLIPKYENINILEKNNNILRENGTYIIIGGLGNIGLEVANYISKTHRTNLILTGRSEFPIKENWENLLREKNTDMNINKKIIKLMQIEKNGSNVRIFSGDVSNKEQMQKIIDSTLSEFKNINGIINAAGVVGKETYKSIEELDEKFINDQFRAKVYGTYIIQELVNNIKLDFYLFMSSLSTTVGGLGLTAYTAANMFINAIAEKNSNETNWKHIDWDGWTFSSKVENNEGMTILPEEGVRALDIMFSSGMLNNIVISVGSLNDRIEKWVVNSNRTLVSNMNSRKKIGKINNYEFNEIEEKLAYIWMDLLGVEDINVNDNFFELGGNSLLATQVIYRMRVELKVDFPIKEFFEAKTIKEVANIIIKNKEDEKKVVDTLNMVKTLSQDEVIRLLNEVKGGKN